MRVVRQSFLRLGSLALLAGTIIACRDTASPPGAPQARPQASRTAARDIVPGQYVVVLRSGVADIPAVARRLAAQHGAQLRHVYTAALHGFAVSKLPDAAVAALRANPLVASDRPTSGQRGAATCTTTSRGRRR